MRVSLLPLGGVSANCYVVSVGTEAAVIDPGEDSSALSRFAQSTELKVRYILLTHGHFDHIGGVAALKEYFPEAKICIGKEDARMTLSADNSLGAFFGFDHKGFEADVLLCEGDSINLGDAVIKVMHTPGHTPGGVIYMAEGVAFCGDTIFRGSIGRCDFPGSSVAQMGQSLKRIASLPRETLLYPGHGEKTTVDHELKTNPYLGRNYDTIFG